MSFDPDPDLEPPARARWRVWLIVLVALVVASGALVWLWQKYDPFFMDRPDMREATALLDSGRKRPLTDEEFERAVALLDAATPAAQLSAVATLEADAARQPARRGA
ncbi:hypothetical protein [Frigoriglobus tundricola]|uniref:Uncharacterized protein n=1 Tax=Frigoriglobus tundricola TaxID=2774151 RepID=A0A6M5YZK8_9BACT|nr:hypothetical protein [Frigoriglobus tundricola]QJW98663.1 hypothetical protein FTUN_6258 [Frigoriglobus tundricola]